MNTIPVNLEFIFPIYIQVPETKNVVACFRGSCSRYQMEFENSLLAMQTSLSGTVRGKHEPLFVGIYILCPGFRNVVNR